MEKNNSASTLAKHRFHTGYGQKAHDAAVELGRSGGTKGGPARADALSSEQRARIAKKAALVRWGQMHPDDPY